MKRSISKRTADDNFQDLNQVMISGQIVSEVHVRGETRYVFTLRNQRGWFYVLWQHPDWIPRKGQRVLARGSVYSVLSENGNITRIQAEEIILLQAENRPWPGKQN